ncbi:MAG: glucose-6-phosphate isomerase [Flavobacteriaceae bacterium]
MSFPKKNPTQTRSWKQLFEHYEHIKNMHMYDMFTANPDRESQMSTVFDEFFVDFSKNRWTSETIDLFAELAEELSLSESIALYFKDNNLNFTEGRAVLHTALRSNEREVLLKGKNIIPEIAAVNNKIKKFTEAIISGQQKGYSGKAFTDVVNIGIGGSSLGPKVVCNALKHYKNHLNTHFVSNIDGDELEETLQLVNPETTLFVVVSKSFTTSETLQNASAIKTWFIKQAPSSAIAKHFIAVSANTKLAADFGISENNIFPMWDWVGGRFSLWSAVGISVALSIGFDNFSNLLKGAEKADSHLKTAKLSENIPVLMAFSSIWYSNFFSSSQEAVIPYSYYLEDFVPYLKQGFMESNGKSVDRNGAQIQYKTGSVLFGGVGSNAQHAFMQLFHQGSHLIPTDFIGFCKALHGNTDHQDVLIANMFAQANALAFGTKNKEVENPYKTFKGNSPSTTFLIDKLTPENLGTLLAFYEHKIFVQGVLLNINSFDQFGVELGKELSRTYINTLNEASTQDSLAMQFYKNNQ